MKIIFFFLVFFINSSLSIACSYAYQYSLFPLGTSGGALILLEVEMERSVNTPDQLGIPRFGNNPTTIEVRWKGTLRLMSYQNKTMQLLKNIATLDINDTDYQEALLPQFRRAMELAQEQPFFEAAELLDVGMCKYDPSCPFFSKEIDTTEAKVFCAINKPEYVQNKATIEFPEIILKKFATQTQQEVADMEKPENTSKVDFCRLWKPYSVRIYSVAGRKLAVYTLGRGQKKFYNSVKSKDWEHSPVGSVEDYVEGNDVLFHGQRFDYMQFL